MKPWKMSIEDITELFGLMMDYRAGKVKIEDRPPFDCLYTLNDIYDERFGNIVIGESGQKIIVRIAKRHLPKEFADEVSPEQFAIDIKAALFSNFVQQEKCLTDERHISSLIAKATNGLRRKMKYTTHYVPFRFFSDLKACFVFGGIRIHPLDDTFLHSSCIKDEGKFCSDYFKQFNAIAEIEISALNEHVSHYKATRIIRLFLAACSFITTGARGYFISSEESPDELIKYKLFACDGNEAQLYSERKFLGLRCSNWMDVLFSSNSFFFIINQVMEGQLNGSKKGVLANRLTDALLVYHDALNEKNTIFRVVKLVSAVERLYLTKKAEITEVSCTNCGHKTPKKEYNTTRRFKGRAKLLLEVIFVEADEKISSLERYYEFRSNVVHGTYSIIEDNFKIDTIELIDLVEEIISTCALFYYQNGIFTATSEKKLDELFVKLEEYAINKSG